MSKTRNIIGWVLTIIIVGFFIMGFVMSATSGEKGAKMAAEMGIDKHTGMLVGVLELLSAILFLIPRTGVLGSMLMAAYLGGAIATHIEHASSPTMAVVFECLVFITAFIRFPEMTHRLLGRTPASLSRNDRTV